MSNPYADWLRQHGTKHFNLGTKAGWIDFVNTGIRPDFRTLTIDEMRGLDPETLEDYNQARNVWNSNPATVKTPQLKNAHDLIDQVMASSHRDGSSVRGAVALDALPGWGKPPSPAATPATSTNNNADGTDTQPPMETPGYP